MVSEHVANLTAANWAAEVEHSQIPVLVDFGANWCPPCRLIAPIVADLAAEHRGALKVGAVDADAESAIVARFGVMGLPTLLIFKDGRPVDKIIGFVPKQELQRRLAPYLA